MKAHEKRVVRAYVFIEQRVEKIPELLMELRTAAGLLAEYGWFDETRIARYSRHEQIEQVRYAIGQAADLWGVAETQQAVRAFERRNAWFVSGWSHDVHELLHQWNAKKAWED